MIELLRRHREKLYLSGDMLFSILVFPCGLVFFREWFDNPDAGIKPTGLVALYAVMAMMHLFRALRLRPKSRQSFIAHLAYAAVFAACTALLLLVAFTDAVCTEVTFRQLSDAEIERYIERHPPYDKAGAYAIQESAALFIPEISGDFYNVIGLPVERLGEMLLSDIFA